MNGFNTYFIASSILLTSCTLSGGFGIHDTSFDSEFQDDKVVGWLQGNVRLDDNISLYIRHESMPFIAEHNTERGGWGINTIGVAGRIKLYD